MGFAVLVARARARAGVEPVTFYADMFHAWTNDGLAKRMSGN
jgi:hypothetical protein